MHHEERDRRNHRYIAATPRKTPPPTRSGASNASNAPRLWLNVDSTAHPTGHNLIEAKVFLKLGEPTWFSERLQQPDPPTSGDAPPESMRPLREVDWSKIVVPHKN